MHTILQVPVLLIETCCMIVPMHIDPVFYIEFIYSKNNLNSLLVKLLYFTIAHRSFDPLLGSVQLMVGGIT